MKEFMMTYYPVANADDSCDDDICECTSDDDGNNITQTPTPGISQRVCLKEPNHQSQTH